MRKKVLFVITKSNWGGAQRYVYDLATNLPNERFETVVAAGEGHLLFEKLDAAGIRTVSVPELKRDISTFGDWRALRSLVSLLRRERPDVVHLNSSKAGVLGAVAARVAGISSIIFTAHGWPFQERKSIVWRATAYAGSWVTALLSTHIICVSDNDLGAARRMPFIGRKSVRIYNGIKLDEELGSGETIRAAFPAGASITGTIGELTKNKNQIALIEEAQREPSMHVAIVGEGEDRAMLEKAIQDAGLESRVKLFGFMPARDALKGFDAFVLPSLKEGLPYVLLEAKAAGLPIRANRVGGAGEVLDAPLEAFTLDEMVEKTAALY